MSSLVRTPAPVGWTLLVVLTVISWALGTQHGFGGDNHVPASLVIIVVAIFKIRVVGLYFMELKDAPWSLRGRFEGYTVLLLGLLTGMYLLPDHSRSTGSAALPGRSSSPHRRRSRRESGL
ncbi:cytochrome C oxidase subunit IV family protein [Mycobacterium sherrisii]|uniref:cytochrome C oxidase subunit IV family protein n=1 Tax=Mycobacterium sherrisii TaxID=243061 RepID=UPI000A15FDA7|nr:cytochrome C oxidase subunit IV family protein [Mycobacterium sherrisii]MCV7032535.1 cytochrome C oxidase subunit IV family protein [Mycobacterium sherrisii]